MPSLALALLTVLPARNAIMVNTRVLLAAPAKAAPAPLHSVEAAPATMTAPVLALPAPLVAVDPILSAIWAHRRSWGLFQVAPDADAATAQEGEYEAAMRLLGTACASRDGARALIQHLQWYLAEESDNLLKAGLGGCHLGAQLKARLAELCLFLPEALPPVVIALPAPKGPSLLLATIEGHRSANLAMAQAVRDYVEAEAAGAPDERHLLAAADRAGDVEAVAFNALMALAPACEDEAHTLTAYLAEVSADFDRDGFGTLVLRRLAIMLANAKAA